MKLSQKKCVPCEGGVPTLTHEQVLDLSTKIHKDWETSGKAIVRSVRYVNFKQTMDVVNRIAEIAEDEGHHPDLYISYALLTVTLTTHAINGLSENDFVLAAKIDEIL